VPCVWSSIPTVGSAIRKLLAGSLILVLLCRCCTKVFADTMILLLNRYSSQAELYCLLASILHLEVRVSKFVVCLCCSVVAY
jgi:hypothetical protein